MSMVRNNINRDVNIFENFKRILSTQSGFPSVNVTLCGWHFAATIIPANAHIPPPNSHTSLFL
jgi:hypothetical protein